MNWKPLKLCEGLHGVEQATFAVSKKIYIHDVSLKNYLILLAKRNESGSQNDN